jgi:hypothetical protein
MEGFTIEEIDETSGLWTMTLRKGENLLTIKQPYGVLEDHIIDLSRFMVGQQLDVQGILQETMDGYQLLILNSDDVTIDE